MIYTIIDSSGNSLSIDSVTKVSENFSGTITSHPVESGSNISDHLFLNNYKLSISGVVSDYSFANAQTVSFNSDGTLNTPLVKQGSATQRLRSDLINCFSNREMLSVVISGKTARAETDAATYGTYENLFITSLSFDDSEESGEAIYPTISLEQVRFVNTTFSQEVVLPKRFDAGATAGATSADGASITTPDTPKKTAEELVQSASKTRVDTVQRQIELATQEGKKLETQIRKLQAAGK